MVRTVISLDNEAKAWVDEQARKSGKTMTAVVREAIACYRVAQAESEKPQLSELLKHTAGIWTQGDGRAWQEKMREEWGDNRLEQ